MKLRNIIFSILLSANAFLLFLLIFEERLVVPAWLQVVGRMHPLVLHFPIVLTVIVSFLLVAAPFFSRIKAWHDASIEIFTCAAAFTSAMAALMGMFLLAAGDYEFAAISLHKWTGVLLSFILFALYAFRNAIKKIKRLSVFLGLMTVFLILAAGHLGAEITHGENFVFEPVDPLREVKQPDFDDALVYDHMILPILEARCMSCHNNRKAKGELVMDTKESLLGGGKSGKLFDTLQPGLGLMMKRINLPQNDKKHMPPAGKPQLSDNEILMIESWVRDGFNFDTKVNTLKETDTLLTFAKEMFKSGDQGPDLEPVSDRLISGLNNNNRLVAPIAGGSGALRVSFYNRSLFSIALIDELQNISKNVTEINLLNMPVTDDDVRKLKHFKNLRKLNLNYTLVTGATLVELSGLAFLNTLSLAGTDVQRNHLIQLTSFPSLRKVYLGNTAISQEDVSFITKEKSNIVFQVGFKDSTILKLNRPVFTNKEVIIQSGTLPIVLKHYINGAEIRYTVDGDDPDSISSIKYKGPFEVSNNTLVKAKAFKKGWVSSDVSQTYFFNSTYTADSAALLTSAKPAYRAKGVSTLIDNKKSDINFASRKWLGFQDNDLSCLFFFNKPVVASNVTLSVLLDISAYVFLPQKIQVWGGDDLSRLRLLTTVNPTGPSKGQPKGNQAIECNFLPAKVGVIKISAEPLERVPSWLQDLKQKGHLFVDEIFFN